MVRWRFLLISLLVSLQLCFETHVRENVGLVHPFDHRVVICVLRLMIQRCHTWDVWLFLQLYQLSVWELWVSRLLSNTRLWFLRWGRYVSIILTCKRERVSCTYIIRLALFSLSFVVFLNGKRLLFDISKSWIEFNFLALSKLIAYHRFISDFILFWLVLIRASSACKIFIITSFLMIACCLRLHRWLLLFFFLFLFLALASQRNENFLRSVSDLDLWHSRYSLILLHLFFWIEFHVHWTRFILLILLFI